MDSQSLITIPDGFSLILLTEGWSRLFFLVEVRENKKASPIEEA